MDGMDRNDVGVLEPGENPGFVSLGTGDLQGHQTTSQVHLLGEEDAGERPRPNSSTSRKPPSSLTGARQGRAGCRAVFPAPALAAGSRRIGQVLSRSPPHRWRASRRAGSSRDRPVEETSARKPCTARSGRRETSPRPSPAARGGSLAYPRSRGMAAGRIGRQVIRRLLVAAEVPVLQKLPGGILPESSPFRIERIFAPGLHTVHRMPGSPLRRWTEAASAWQRFPHCQGSCQPGEPAG